ncbi:adh short, KR, Epimerase, and/or NAD binding 10 domain containing protein [Asbolus verrucosus]|uniref:Adh short, KR, Epimerase, and/or NAD binding 10 domain containing protein n=1 Tax=Asbolus verrucosus TaxID=1661398 RepID=A0A482W8N2_ASBVE|nr:adh short, KR, Epimerase, and/or NAD binding 10 domain containing protein [Asbolus verrucosus]
MVLSMVRWCGKVAVVTGASSGNGAAIAQRLVNEGLIVAGLARRSERVEELSKKLSGAKGKLYAVKADVTKEEDILKAFRWVCDNLGPVHILVNNAGVMPNTSLTEGPIETWKRIFDVNVIGLCVATKEAVRIMRANNIDGHIVHIASLTGHVVPHVAEMNVYPASKSAVVFLTETLRKELNEMGSKIKISSVSPGAIRTPLWEKGADSFNTDPNLMQQIPFLQSEDIADAVTYILSTPPHAQVHDIIIRPVGQKD